MFEVVTRQVRSAAAASAVRALPGIASGIAFGVADHLLRPVGGALHMAWTVKASLAWLHQLVSLS